MELSSPKNVTFLVAVVLFVLGFLGTVASVSFLAPFAVWLLIAAFVLLALGVLLKGL